MYRCLTKPIRMWPPTSILQMPEIVVESVSLRKVHEIDQKDAPVLAASAATIEPTRIVDVQTRETTFTP